MTNPFEKSPVRPTWATVDLAALAHNYSSIMRHVSPGVKLLGVVKADAYGHGALPVARKLEALGVRALAVATVEEGAELRDGGIHAQIIVMGGLMGGSGLASERVLKMELTPVIHSRGVLATLNRDAAAFRKEVRVHLKIDTGMSRLGVRPEVLQPVLDVLKDCSHVKVEGVMTHLASGDNEEISSQQVKRFLECRAVIEKMIGPVRIWHVANSAALMRGEQIEIPQAQEVWARPGLALYGCAPGSSFGEKLKPVMGLVSQAVLLKNLPAGTKVSYGGTFTTTRATCIAIVPIGYADGYPWALSGKAWALMCGRRAPVIGRVTMDMIILDVTDIDGVSVGDEVVLLGGQGEERITLTQLADWAGTIPYEIICGISKRMPRVYKGE